MIVPDELFELIKRFEGLRLRAYYCPAGVLTCGYGSTGPEIKPDTVWTSDEAEERMRRDAEVYCNAAKSLCPSLEGPQLAAVADFAYNLGATRLASSTLRRKINSGDLLAAADEFDKWVYGGGKKLPGLIARRQAEKTLFLTPKADDDSDDGDDADDGTAEEADGASSLVWTQPR